ncbi:MAG: RDD family protein, partial [Candidatus Omnitrophica bacterium]|nr:RDD family protein [Candidatus Omnitrophota bacterium]
MEDEASPAQSLTPPFPIEYAKVGWRFLALVLDGLIFLVLFRALRMFPLIDRPVLPASGSPLEIYQEAIERAIRPFILKSFLYLVILTSYKVLLVGKYGATLGKMALGLKVVKEDGTPVAYGTAL